MAKKKKKLTRKYKKQIQKRLREDPEARKLYVETVATAVRNVLLYVRTEAHKENEGWDKQMELTEFIREWPDKLKEQILIILNLAAGEDIEIRKKKKEKLQRWELLDLG